MPRSGRIDHAQKGDIVARIVEQQQVGQDVLDFRALKEFQPIDDLIRDPLLAQREFQDARQALTR